MKLLCPRCKAGKEIGSASRFTIFSCDSCGNRFRGVHADVAKWDRLFKNLFTFDTSVHWLTRTGCPHCGGLVPLVENRSGSGFLPPATCMCCGKSLPTKPAHALTPGEMAEVEGWFAGNQFEEERLVRLERLLADTDLPPDQDKRLRELIAVCRRRSGVTPPPVPGSPPAPAVGGKPGYPPGYKPSNRVQALLDKFKGGGS